MINLATEIVDHILSFLDVYAESEYNDLKACAQVHPFLLEPAERLLFSDIRLHSGQTVGRVFSLCEFSELLREKPHLAIYVRALALELICHALDARILSPEIVEGIIHKLPRLEAIEIGLAIGSKPIRWRWLPESLQEAFMTSFALPSIKRLSVIQIGGFPMGAFDQCSRLEELSLDGYIDFSGTNFTIKPHNLHSQLKSLSIFDWSNPDIFSGIITWVNPLNLRRLDVCLPYLDQFASLSDLIRVCSSITDLELDFLDKYISMYEFDDGELVLTDIEDAMEELTLSPLTDLEHLTIHAVLPIEDQEEIPTPLPSIARLLETVPSVKRLSLLFHYHLETWESFLDLDWSHLRPLSAFPAIQRAELWISAQISGLEDIEPSDIVSSLEGDDTIMDLMNKGFAIQGKVHDCRHRQCVCGNRDC